MIIKLSCDLPLLSNNIFLYSYDITTVLAKQQQQKKTLRSYQHFGLNVKSSNHKRENNINVKKTKNITKIVL